MQVNVLAAGTEPGIFLRGRWRPKQELKRRSECLLKGAKTTLPAQRNPLLNAVHKEQD